MCLALTKIAALKTMVCSKLLFFEVLEKVVQSSFCKTDKRRKIEVLLG
jgi:hypothetical protein